MRPSRWGAPFHHARFGLFEVPARGLLVPVVVTARRAQITFARRSVRPRDRVVRVGFRGGPVAAGRGALGRPRLDEMLNLPADHVPVRIMPVIAAAFRDRGKLYPEPAQ